MKYCNKNWIIENIKTYTNLKRRNKNSLMELESINTVLTPFCHIIYQTFSRKWDHIIGPIITTRPVQPPSPPPIVCPSYTVL